MGNLISMTDRKSQTLSYTYDQGNRLTQKAYPDSSAVTYSYDLASRLTQASDPTGTYQFTFDNMGRMQTTTTNYAFLTGRSFTTGYGYDAGSNRTGFTDPENGTSSYVYDNLNRLNSLASPLGTFGFGYDVLSRRTSLTRPNAVNTAYGYDPLSRLLSVVHQKAGTTLDGATYTVDAAGNRTSKGDLQANVTSNYTYESDLPAHQGDAGGFDYRNLRLRSCRQPAELVGRVELHQQHRERADGDLERYLYLRQQRQHFDQDGRYWDLHIRLGL